MSETYQMSGTVSDSQVEFIDSSNQKKRKGCWVGPGAAFAIVIAAAVVALIVGLCVFYLHPDKGKGVTTTSAPPTTTPNCERVLYNNNIKTIA